MIHEHLEYPSKDQWIEIEGKSKIAQLYLDVKLPETLDFLSFFGNQELLSWIRLFNNRIGQSRMSYIFFMHYYNKGIPDEEWFISPGKEGQSIQYFPHFENKTFYYKTMFDYYIDNFYYKFFSAWDTIYHILNVYYQFDIQPGSGFNGNVMKRLQQKNQELHKIILLTNKSKPFKLSRTLRNDITHNFAPNDISSGISRQKEKGKVKKVSYGVGKYTPSKVFVENINGIIEEFILLLKALKTRIEDHA